jgi:hypothetical protein
VADLLVGVRPVQGASRKEFQYCESATYTVFCSYLQIVESSADFLLCYIPFYMFIKVGLMWNISRFVRPFLTDVVFPYRRPSWCGATTPRPRARR